MEPDELEVQPELEVEGEIESTEVDIPEEEALEEHEPSGGGRVQRLARERAEYREQLQTERAKREEYERLLHEQMLRHQQPAQQEDLDPMQAWTKRVEQTMHQQMLTQQDALDATRYEMKAAQNTIYKKYQGKVEEELSKLRRNGSGAPRETILKYLVGDEALSGQLKAPKPKVATSTTPSMKSTVKATKSEPSLKERLSNIRL